MQVRRSKDMGLDVVVQRTRTRAVFELLVWAEVRERRACSGEREAARRTAERLQIALAVDVLLAWHEGEEVEADHRVPA